MKEQNRIEIKIRISNQCCIFNAWNKAGPYFEVWKGGFLWS